MCELVLLGLVQVDAIVVDAVAHIGCPIAWGIMVSSQAECSEDFSNTYDIIRVITEH